MALEGKLVRHCWKISQYRMAVNGTLLKSDTHWNALPLWHPTSALNYTDSIIVALHGRPFDCQRLDLWSMWTMSRSMRVKLPRILHISFRPRQRCIGHLEETEKSPDGYYVTMVHDESQTWSLVRTLTCLRPKSSYASWIQVVSWNSIVVGVTEASTTLSDA